LAGQGGILIRMRPKAQLALKELAMRKPSGVRDFLSELKKNESVSGYHFLPAREPQWADLPADLDPAVRGALSERGIEINPEKIFTIMDMELIKNLKGAQRLTGCLVALSRVISCLGKRCMLLYKLLKKSERIE